MVVRLLSLLLLSTTLSSALLVPIRPAPAVAAPGSLLARTTFAVTDRGAVAERGALSAVRMKEKVQKDVLELDGTVIESLPNANFRVQLNDSEQVREAPPPRPFPAGPQLRARCARR